MRLEKFLVENGLQNDHWCNRLTYRETPSHGYYKPSGDIAENIPQKFRQTEYEEDAQWCVPVIFNRHLFGREVQINALRTAVQYHPDEFEYLTGETLPFGVSYIKDDRTMREQGVRVVMVGMGDWAFDIPKGYIFVSTGVWQFDGIAHTRREPKGFLLTEEQYQTAKTYGATGYKIEGENWHPCERDETFYTWDAYTKATGNPRYK